MYVGKVAVRYWHGGWLELDVLWTLPRWQNRHTLAISMMVLAWPFVASKIWL
jgi:hypothetical protein